MTKIVKARSVDHTHEPRDGAPEAIPTNDSVRLESLVKRQLFGVLGVPAERQLLRHLAGKYPEAHQDLAERFRRQIKNTADQYELETLELKARCRNQDPSTLRVVERWIFEKREIDFMKLHGRSAYVGSPWTGPDRRTFMN